MLEGKSVDTLKTIFKGHEDTQIDSFCKSLPYYLLTGRKGLKVFQNGNTTLCISKHPHNDSCLLVFPEIEGDFSLTVRVLNRLAQSGLKVQLARYTKSNYKQLKQAIAANTLTIIKNIELKEEDILDWKYPAHILDTVKVATLSGNKLKNVRQKFNGVSSNLDILPLLHPDAVKGMRAAVLLWESGMIFAGNETDHNMTEFYGTLVKHVVAFPSLFDGFVLSNGKESLGFSIWDYTGNTANSLASLSKRSIDGVSDFQKVTACKMLAAKGIKRFNLGGSETESLDDFKLKFQPCESIELLSYDVEFEDFSLDSVISVNAIRSEDMRFDSV